MDLLHPLIGGLKLCRLSFLSRLSFRFLDYLCGVHLFRTVEFIHESQKKLAEILAELLVFVSINITSVVREVCQLIQVIADSAKLAIELEPVCWALLFGAAGFHHEAHIG